MLNNLIKWSLDNRLMVVAISASVMLTGVLRCVADAGRCLSRPHSSHRHRPD